MAAVKTYQRLSILEKRAVDLLHVHEPPMPCPDCGTKVLPVDFLAHLRERCLGSPDPGPSAKWVSWRDAIALKVPRETLSRWVERGFVRMRGERGDREYLLRDLALKIAQRNGFRRRQSQL